MSAPFAPPFPAPPRRLSVVTYFLAPFRPWVGMGIFLLMWAVVTVKLAADATFLSRQFSDDDPQTTGTIVSADRPTSSRGNRSKGPVHCRYVYSVGGKQYTGVSHSDEYVEVGAQVSVKYVARAPELSHIVGMDVPGHWGWYFLVMTVAISPCGLGCIIVDLKAMQRDLHWLRHCLAVNGTVTVPNAASPGSFNFHFTDLHGRGWDVMCTGAPGQFAQGQSVLGAYLPALAHKAAPFDLLPKGTRRALRWSR